MLENFFYTKTLPIILNHQVNAGGRIFERDIHNAGLGVAHNIGNGFLSDAKNHCPDIGCQARF